MSNKLTIQRVAELADVSKATVSRVLNGYPHVRPEVREKVERVISETGYRPNHIARLLASDRSSIIGLVISSDARMVFTDPYFASLTESVSRGAAGQNLILSLFVSYTEKQGRHTLNGILSTGLLDGLVLTADYKGDSLIPQLQKAGIPFVFVGRPRDAEGVDYVDVDNWQGGYIGTKHLAESGYRRIATVTCVRDASGVARFEGYQQALAEYGIAYDESLVAYGDYSLESAYRGMKRLIKRKPDAIFVASDTMALGALRALREQQVRVPGDIALVSFDDLPHALLADPPLTTVRQPIAQTGQLAVDQLAQIIARGGVADAQHTILPVELIVRESCGAVQLQ